MVVQYPQIDTTVDGLKMGKKKKHFFLLLK